MSDRNSKDLRKQLRHVVREMIDEVLTQELSLAAYTQVQKHINDRLTALEAEVRKTLARMEDGTKNFQGYMMRQLADESARLAAAANAPKPESDQK